MILEIKLFCFTAKAIVDTVATVINPNNIGAPVFGNSSGAFVSSFVGSVIVGSVFGSSAFIAVSFNFGVTVDSVVFSVLSKSL